MVLSVYLESHYNKIIVFVYTSNLRHADPGDWTDSRFSPHNIQHATGIRDSRITGLQNATSVYYVYSNFRHAYLIGVGRAAEAVAMAAAGEAAGQLQRSRPS